MCCPDGDAISASANVFTGFIYRDTAVLRDPAVLLECRTMISSYVITE